MKINKALSNESLDVWECKCGTHTPVRKGSPKPECEYCRRVKEKGLKEPKLRLNHMCVYCNKIIWIGDGGIINTSPCHYSCYKDLIKKQTLAEVGKILRDSHKKCFEGLADIKRQKPRENNTPRDWEQRMDELALVYSYIFNISINEAKKEIGI